METKLLDKLWRMNHLYKVVNKAGQLVPFQRNRAQRHFNAHRCSRNITLKSRQLGFTTDESIDMLDDVLFTPNLHALMLSYDIASQLDIFDKKIDFTWQNFPEELAKLWKVDRQRASELKFDFGNGATSSLQVRTKGRSGTFGRLHISELGKICKHDPAKAKEIISGTIQAVPIYGLVDIESTAEGEFGAFHDMFWEAWDRGEPQRAVDYKAHFYNWTWDDYELSRITTPERNLPKDFKEYQLQHGLTDLQITYYYYKWLTLKKDWELLHQEYPTTPHEAFIASGSKLFNVEKLLSMPLEEGKQVGDWIYYDDYVPGHTYALAGDPSEGIGKDCSAAVVIDFSFKKDRRLQPKVVAEFISDRVAPDMFAYELKSGAQAYGNCLIAVERNGSGLATLTKLKDIYYNIFSEVKMDKINNQPTEKLGWITSVATKPKMLYDLSSAVNNDDIIIPSNRIIREARTYGRDDLGRVQYDEVFQSHWDLLMATAICYQMAQYAIPSEIRKDPDEMVDDEPILDKLDHYDIMPRYL